MGYQSEPKYTSDVFEVEFGLESLAIVEHS